MGVENRYACFFWIVLGILLSEAGYSRAADELRPKAPNPQELAQGRRIYEANCAICHGVWDGALTEEQLWAVSFYVASLNTGVPSLQQRREEMLGQHVLMMHGGMMHGPPWRMRRAVLCSPPSEPLRQICYKYKNTASAGRKLARKVGAK